MRGGTAAVMGSTLDLLSREIEADEPELGAGRRRGEGLSIWVVPSAAITASDPADKGMLFEPTASKIYRHPTFYKLPESVDHM